MPALLSPAALQLATGATVERQGVSVIQVSSPSAKLLDRCLTGMVDLRIKVQPRVVWVERWALI